MPDKSAAPTNNEQLSKVETERRIKLLQENRKLQLIHLFPIIQRYWMKNLEGVGLSFTCKDDSGRRMEIVELPSHPYFVGAIPLEFKSRPRKPSAVFLGLVAATCTQLDAFTKKGAATKISHRMMKTDGSSTAIKAYLYDKPATTKLSNGSLDGIYCNGNIYMFDWRFSTHRP